MDIQGPYDGKLIEMSTNEERANSFNCIRGDRKFKIVFLLEMR